MFNLAIKSSIKEISIEIIVAWLIRIDKTNKNLKNKFIDFDIN